MLFCLIISLHGGSVTHNKTIPRIVEYGERILAEKKLRQELLSNKVDKGKEVYRPSIQERISDQTRLLLAEVECEVDTFLANDCKKSKFDLYKFLQKIFQKLIKMNS